MFVVVVEFVVRAGCRDRFVAAVSENARQSRSLEVGCLRFDVCEDPGQPDALFLYEIYQSALAFQDHLKTDHFKQFDRVIVDWVAHKSVRTLSLVCAP